MNIKSKLYDMKIFIQKLITKVDFMSIKKNFNNKILQVNII